MAIVETVANPLATVEQGVGLLDSAATASPAPTATTETPVTAVLPEEPITTERGRDRDRTRDDTRARSAQELKPKDTYYRPEYGWVMSDADVATEKTVKGQYDTNISDATSQIVKNESDFKTALTTGKAGINSAYDTAIAAAVDPEKDMVTVAAYNGGNVLGTYRLPRSVAQQIETGFARQATEGYYGTAWAKGDDNTLYVEVNNKTHPDSDFAKENSTQLTNALGGIKTRFDASKQTYSASVANAATERAAELASFETSSNTIYATNKATWDAQLAELQSGYSNRVATGKQQYETKKKQYNESITGMSDVGLLG
jgi:hypothetical protein